MKSFNALATIALLALPAHAWSAPYAVYVSESDFDTVMEGAKSAIAELKAKGINVGLVRPITVWPFPYDAVREAACQDSVKAVLDVELNEGQMLEDVKLAINGAKPIDFTGHCGSQMPTTDEIVEKILSMKEGK